MWFAFKCVCLFMHDQLVKRYQYHYVVVVVVRTSFLLSRGFRSACCCCNDAIPVPSSTMRLLMWQQMTHRKIPLFLCNNSIVTGQKKSGPKRARTEAQEKMWKYRPRHLGILGQSHQEMPRCRGAMFLFKTCYSKSASADIRFTPTKSSFNRENHTKKPLYRTTL